MKEHNDVIKAMISDMEKTINRSNDGYYTTPKIIKRGNYTYEEMGKWPSIAVSLPRRGTEDPLFDEDLGLDQFTVKISGYARTDGKGDLDELHDLESDVMYFLRSGDFSHNAKFVMDLYTDYYEGHIEDPAAEFFIFAQFYIYA